MQEVVQLFCTPVVTSVIKDDETFDALKQLGYVKNSDEVELAISLINYAKNLLKNQIVTYFCAIYNERLRDISIRASCEKSYLKQKGIIDAQREEQFERINRVFSEFQVVSPTIIIYGSKEYSNYYICRLGIKDRYKNAFWIHENSIRELIQDIPPEFPVHEDAENYFKLLNSLKTLAQLS